MIALIPAREGSKGLPDKNIRPLNGKPLIAHTIEAALTAEKVDEVYVSTDSERIANIAKTLDARVPVLRPKHLALDDSKVIDTYNFMLDYWLKEDLQVDSFVVLQPTSPLRKASHIDEAIEMFFERDADSVISYTPSSHPVTWYQCLGEDGSFEPIFDVELNNRQSHRNAFLPNGAIYVFKSNLLRKNKYYSEKSYAYVMERKYSVDIDDLIDFEYASFLMSRDIGSDEL